MAGLLALAAGAGCTGLPQGLTALSEGMAGGAPDKAERELAAGEAARVCFSLGRDLEKGGYLGEAAGQY